MAELTDIIETVSDSFGRAYLDRHDAIWIISRGVVYSDVQSGRLAPLDIDTSETRGAVGFTTRADALPSLSLQIMVSTIRGHVMNLGKSFLDPKPRGRRPAR
jgi:LysR family pca operon transcriptional activator